MFFTFTVGEDRRRVGWQAGMLAGRINACIRTSIRESSKERMDRSIEGVSDRLPHYEMTE